MAGCIGCKGLPCACGWRWGRGADPAALAPQVDTAHAMVQWMRRGGLQPSAYTYSALMTLPRGGGGPAEAREVLAKVGRTVPGNGCPRCFRRCSKRSS